MAKKEKRKRRKVRKGSLYEITPEGVKRKNRFCPKCGEGVFMAKHKDRETCGRCHYTEFKVS
ncbi:MAG TPA: 30S ribosomal protein S27ae [Candidatus Altiarchaeales archaeon]|nr:30S ribosomal protein S27ae [Candidatus Altiarchaeales archaeon]